MSNKTYPVIVHKANIPLMPGESLFMYLDVLRKAAKEYLFEKFSTSEDSSAWALDVYASVAVFELIDWGDETKSMIVALDVSRDDTGTFSFSNPQEVRVVTGYETVKPETLPVLKDWSLANPVEVQKSMWANIL